MHAGAEPVEDVDVLLLESTYSNREHPERKGLEKEAAKAIGRVTGNGGNLLFPSFAVGRTQEMFAMVRAQNKEVPVFVDGMGKAVTEIYLTYPEYLRDAEEFRDAANDVTYVREWRDRKDATSVPSVIISTAGMLQGGPALGYLLNLLPGSEIIFTGYNVEGTNGWMLMNEGRIKLDENILEVETPVGYLDFSAHAGRKGLLEYVKRANPQKIVLNHGDNTLEFKEELEGKGYEVYAPKNGDVLEL
jgi:putative mRNA 3-end processing factor